MTLLPFFTWCSHTSIAIVLRDSTWMFPVIETFHLLALSVIGGAILVVDLRLLGVGLSSVSVARLAREVEPWMLGALGVMLVSGVLLFLSEPIKCYDNAAFWWKMAFLAAAIVFTFSVRRRVAGSAAPANPSRQRAVAAISVVLWSGVGIAGRGIAFY